MVGILKQAAYLALGLFLLGCGGTGGSGGGGGGRTIGDVSALLNVGDAASDRIVSFKVTVNSVTFKQSSGSDVPVLTLPATVELIHRNADVEPVIIRTNFPQGSYTQVTVVLGGATATLVDSLGNLIVKTVTVTPSSVAVPLTADLSTVNSATLNVELDLANSIAIDGSNNVTLTPTYIVQGVPTATVGTQIPETGAIRDMQGSVVSVAAPNLTVYVNQAAMNFTFVTNSSTTLTGIGSVGALVPGNLVELDAQMQNNGSLTATKLEAVNTNADPMAVQGQVNLVTGAPATSFTMIVQNPIAKSTTVTVPTIGATDFNVTVGAATFELDADEVDLSGLSFTPTFNASTLTRIQQVMAVSDTASFTTVTATRIRLQRQAFSGQITGITTLGAQSVFTLTPPAGSAFPLLTGQTTLTVVVQPGTELRNGTSVLVGANVRVRGLLFNNGGALVLVADRMTTP
ncbi:MAG: DUF4382 domain-containing protein [Candidatus Koribacter versatilis]|uniref:DUF4382 domain-containing protein n=1 Tax=Candidatus Korobacter versatilis TaxID=658062 RepID=A0A932EPY8_9BACT|nr:DUF4382 domain-containing protein [Candidatus Koribacter versatilis]